MTRLYHLHIPRTSGTGILYAMAKSFNINREKSFSGSSEMHAPGIFEFQYNHKTMSSWPVLSGHFAVNPILQSDFELDTFSIIREPVDHFVSLAGYRAMSSRREFTNESLDAFIEGRHDTLFGCRLFSQHGNLQTRMLTCRIVDIREILYDGIVPPATLRGTGSEGAWFVESDFPKNETELINRISNFDLFEMNDRKQLNEYLIKQFKTKFNVEFIGTGNEKINSSVRSSVKPSPSQVAEIEKRCDMDLILYEYVRSRAGVKRDDG